MPVQVLLRGFEPDIPEDQTVTFSEDLPSSVLCIQCKNVSSKLYKDPKEHAYCEMCKVLGTNADTFNCSRCQEMFNVEKLVIDETIGHQLHKKIVICPGTTESEAFEIPFHALKAYLKGISSDSASRVSRPGKDDDCTQPKENNPQYKCVICKQTMPKKTMTQHVKSCLRGPQQGRLDSRPGEENTQQAHGHNAPGGLKTKVECPLCSTLLNRKDIAMHMSEKCPKRLVECKFCRGDVEACNKEVHEASCRHQPGICEHCQKEFRTIAQLEDEHYPKCEEMPVNCSFHKLGCTFVVARRELPAHEGTTTHAELLIGHICKLQAENQSLRQRLEQQEVTHRDKIEKMKDSQCDTDILKKTVSVLQEDIKSLQIKWEKHMKQHEQENLKFERQNEDICKIFKQSQLSSSEQCRERTTMIHRALDLCTQGIQDTQELLVKMLKEHCQQCDEKFLRLNSRR